MSDLDDLLQKGLEAEKDGALPEQEAVELTGEAEELKPLISLAAAISTVPHPEPAPAKTEAGLQKLLAASDKALRPRWRAFGWAMAGAVGALLILVTVMGIALTGLVIGRRYDTALVSTLNGFAQVARANGDWRTLEIGDRLRSGERLRVYAASNLTLQFYDGSQVVLGPETDLTLELVQGDPTDGLQVHMMQTSGETTHNVIPFQDRNSSYILQTPSGEARVQGTSFAVDVDPVAGIAYFTVMAGSVTVNAGDEEVVVEPGQATVTQPGYTPQAPAYQFHLRGEVSALSEESLTVAGMVVQVTEQTVFRGRVRVGKSAVVDGRILEDGTWVADMVHPGGGSASSRFTGVLEAMGEVVWQIGGVPVLVDERTSLAEDLELEDLVTVEFRIQDDGQWLARAIYLADEPPSQTEPTPSPEPGAHPSLVFEPDELEAAGCQADYMLIGTLLNEADDPDDDAGNVLLGYTILQGAEYVSAIELIPDSWEIIEPGQTVTFTIHIALNELWLNAPAATEFRLRIYIASEANNPGGHPSTLTVILMNTCNGTPTPTVTPTPTGTPQATGEPCNGADPHPTGMTLAERYAVPYQEIMNWFCTYHLGFGEIDHGYSLSLETGVPVADIFAMRLSGMGWGNIRKELTGGNGNRNNP